MKGNPALPGTATDSEGVSGTPAPTSAPGAGRPASPPLLPLVLLLVLGLFWGAGFNMAKLASQNGVAPIGYAMWQSLPSGLIVLAFIMARGGRLPTGRRYLLFYAFAGIAGIAIPNMIAYGVIAHIPVGVWGVIINLAPLFTYLAALTLGAERIHPLRASGVVIGLIGVMLLVLPDSSLPDAGMVAWVLLGVLTPLIYGITNVLNARWIDFDFWGHQITAHLVDQDDAVSTNPVDGDQVPARHFGVILAWADWQALADKLTAAKADFLIQPRVRFKGEAGEQATMFVRDPSGNALEFKSFQDMGQVFAR